MYVVNSGVSVGNFGTTHAAGQVQQSNNVPSKKASKKKLGWPPARPSGYFAVKMCTRDKYIFTGKKLSLPSDQLQRSNIETG